MCGGKEKVERKSRDERSLRVQADGERKTLAGHPRNRARAICPLAPAVRGMAEASIVAQPGGSCPSATAFFPDTAERKKRESAAMTTRKRSTCRPATAEREEPRCIGKALMRPTIHDRRFPAAAPPRPDLPCTTSFAADSRRRAGRRGTIPRGEPPQSGRERLPSRDRGGCPPARGRKSRLFPVGAAGGAIDAVGTPVICCRARAAWPGRLRAGGCRGLSTPRRSCSPVARRVRVSGRGGRPRSPGKRVLLQGRT
jgi:hypothetical protein